MVHGPVREVVHGPDPVRWTGPRTGGQCFWVTRVAVPYQFSSLLGDRANFHSRFLCYQCVFDPIPLSALSLFSCALAFSSNLICWRPKEIYRRAENQCHCCGIYHFQRPDLICDMPASNPASPPSRRFPCSREKSSSQKHRYSVVNIQAHTEKGTCTRDLCYAAKEKITPDEVFKTEVLSIKREAK